MKTNKISQPRLGFYIGALAVGTSAVPQTSLSADAESLEGAGRGAERRQEDAGEDQRRRRIEEIIVTATKREERIQDIPLSIAVLSHEDLERRSVIGMQDYLRSIPGVNQIDNGSRSNAIVIRGIATALESQNQSSGATVSSYFDEVPITGAAGPVAGGVDIRPVDIERIEVLRGPQGTAFGSSSLSGAVRIIPAKPKLDDFGGKVSASYSETSRFGSDNAMIQGVANIPIVEEKFAVRAVGYRYDESGYYRNIGAANPRTMAIAEATGLGDYVRGYAKNDIGSMVSTGGRIAALWQATDRMSLSLNYMTQKLEQDGDPYSSVGSYEQTNGPIAPQGRVRGEEGEVSGTDMDLAGLVMNYDLPWAKVTSAVSWVDSNSVVATSFLSEFFGPSSYTIPSDFQSLAVETRLASQLAGPLQFLGGVFYENVDQSLDQTIDWPSVSLNSPVGTNPIYHREQARELEQRAVFGEVSYDIAKGLTATVGVRYFEYDKSEDVLQEGGLVGIPLGNGNFSTVKSGENDSTFKASLSYKTPDDGLIYASWAQGFRLGQPTEGLVPFASVCDADSDGIVDGTTIPIASTRNIKSDFLDNYEIGGKFMFFDRRVALETTFYHIEWDGLPLAASAGACPAGYIANAGSATSDGVEFQSSILMIDGLRLDLGAGYSKAQLSEDTPALGAVDGARLPGSPKVNANLSIQYDFAFVGYDAFIRADSFYTGKFYGDLLESPSTIAGDYIKADMRLGVTINALSIEIFGRNLTNEDAYTWRGVVAPPPIPVPGYQLRPRTIGLQLSYALGPQKER